MAEISTAAAAVRAGRSEPTIRRWAATGTIRARRVGKRTWLIDDRSIPLPRQPSRLTELLLECEPYLRNAAPRSDTERTPAAIHRDIVELVGEARPYDPNWLRGSAPDEPRKPES